MDALEDFVTEERETSLVVKRGAPGGGNTDVGGATRVDEVPTT